MWFVLQALRRPVTILVLILGVVIAAVIALVKIPIDIFPNLGVPVIYVAQPYGGLSPEQMEGHISSFYETQFLYIGGIKSIESKNIQGAAIYKLSFQPGTNMAAAMAETVQSVNRAHAFMPKGTVPPQLIRFDAGNVPVGQLVFSSATRSIGEIQDIASYKVRPMFAALPGVSSPPPFGGNVRSIVIHIDSARLRDYHLSPDDIISAISANNQITPAGNLRIGELNRLTPINTIVDNIHELEQIPIKAGSGPTVFLRDLGFVTDSTDILAGYALVNGKRSVFIPVTKRSDASTWSVVQEVKNAIPAIQDAIPADVHVSYEFDQSHYVIQALSELTVEGLLGAILTGLMVLLFLQCWRSTLIVVATIPISILTAIVCLFFAGQTINTMTLGGLALAVGILVDMATVVIENIHTQLSMHKPVARAVVDSAKEVSLPILLALLCILAVFLPSFAMSGVPKSLFVPLSLAVGFSLVAAYVFAQTLVPIMAIWLLKKHTPQIDDNKLPHPYSLTVLTQRYVVWLHQKILRPIPWLLGYAIVTGIILIVVGTTLGRDLFPAVNSNEFKFRLKAPEGTRVEESERLTLKALNIIREETHNKVNISLSYVGMQPSNYAISLIYLWTAGPQEAVVQVALDKEAHIDTNHLKDILRARFHKELPSVNVSFEPADLVSQVMSQGALTPVEIAISGKSLTDDIEYGNRIKEQLAKIPYLRDIQYGQTFNYPTVNVNIDRERAGQMGLTVQDVSRSIIAATSSTRFTQPNYWMDKKNGNVYQVQVEIPQSQMTSIEDLQNVPITNNPSTRPLIGDVANLSYGSTYGEIDRLNSQRTITLIANIQNKDLGTTNRDIESAIRRVGKPPRGVHTIIRGQLQLMQETVQELATGLVLAIIAIFLLLAANFQSFKLSFVVTSTIPAVLSGVCIVLFITGTTFNIQSAMGAIMSMGVSVANAILLVTVAEEHRQACKVSVAAAIEGAKSRVRPILMTSLAMVVGMIPMASGLGEGGGQSAPLGRAVIGGILASTVAVLFILPVVFAWAQSKASTQSVSLHPDDPESPHFNEMHSSSLINPQDIFHGHITAEDCEDYKSKIKLTQLKDKNNDYWT